MSFRDARTIWRLEGLSGQYPAQPELPQAAQERLAVPETPINRSTSHALVDSGLPELPGSRPWLLTANGMLGSQVNTAGWRHSAYVEGSIAGAMRNGLFLRSAAEEDYSREHVGTA